jgi:predicted Zn-dependent protease
LGDNAPQAAPAPVSDAAKDAVRPTQPTGLVSTQQPPSSSPSLTGAKKKPARHIAQPADASAPEPLAPPEPPVEQQFADLTVAMKTQNWEEAQRLLGTLRQRLPGSNIALLRAQAWTDLQQGRSAKSIEGYRELLQRLPGDEEAAINLAGLLLQSNEAEAARQTLLQAAQLHPDSARLRGALRQFNPEVRP